MGQFVTAAHGAQYAGVSPADVSPTTYITYQAADGSGWWLHVPATTSPEPTALDCTLIGHICLVTGKTKPVPCRELTLLKAYACGIREPESRQRWTSNVRYIVYEWRGDFSRPQVEGFRGWLRGRYGGRCSGIKRPDLGKGDRSICIPRNAHASLAAGKRTVHGAG